LFVYEPLFVDVRRRLAGTRVGWTRLLSVQRSPGPLNVQRQSPRRRFIARIAGVAYAEAFQARTPLLVADSTIFTKATSGSTHP
jgi:hypothetical protein